MESPTRWMAAAAGAIALSLTLIGCSAADPESVDNGGASKETLKIGFATPLTGVSSASGSDALDGAQLAVTLANESEALPDYTIELLVEDDTSTPEGGAIAVQKLRDEGAQAITGVVNSSIAVAESNLLAGDPDVLFIVSGAQSQAILDEQPTQNVFGLTHNNAQFGAANLGWIKENAKPKKVAVLVENSDFGINDLHTLEETWKSGTPDIVLKETYERTQTDFSSVLALVRESGADALYVTAGSPTNAAALFDQADQLGLKVDKFMNSGLMTKDLIAAGGDAVDGLVSADTFHADGADGPEGAAFVEAFTAEYGEAPGPLHELGYTSINLIIEAMKAAESTTDMEAASVALREGTWATPRGELTWDETGRALTGTFMIGIENGELVVVEKIPKK